MLPRRRLLGSNLHDGIGLNFATGQYYVREQGRPANVQPLTSLFTFTGGAESRFMGPAGLLVASATNTPRIEYDASGNCLGLLMEAARTNLCLQSQDLATTWVPGSSTISANFGVAPDGTTTSDKVVENGSAGVHSAQQNITVAATTTYTLTAYLRSAGRQWGFLFFDDGAANGVSAVFDLSGGTVSKAAFSNGTGSGAVASIVSAGNGFFRCRLSGQIPATTGRVSIGPSSTASPGTAFPNYTGDSSSGVEVWGVQLELGAFPSSYIPTTTVSVARTADSCIRTLGSEFSATAGTVVVAGRASGGQDAANSQYVYGFDDGTFNERFAFIRLVATDTARFVVSDGGVSQAALDGTFTNSTTFKAAAAWTLNDFAASFNGAAATTDAVGTLPTVTTLGMGVSSFNPTTTQANGHILRFDYYPSRLPNTYLVSAST